MAKNDKNTAAAAEIIDFSQYIPADLAQQLGGKVRLEETGLLTPLYRHEQAWEMKFGPVIGYWMGIEQLPVDDFDAMVLRVELTVAAKGCTGKSDDMQIVDVKAGEQILVPINGKLRNNRKLLQAAMDRKNYFFGIIQPLGPRKVNKKPSEMWDYKVMQADVGLTREGTRFEFRTADVPLLAQTGDGTVYDMRTGEAVNTTERVPARTPAAQANASA